MTTIIIVSVFALLALTAFSLTFRSRRKHVAEGDILPLDLSAFSVLIDRQDEEFLRLHMTKRQFFHLKRQRINVTWKYVNRMSDNSAVVLRMAGMARQDANSDVVETAAQLADQAAQLRTQCLIAFGKLAAEFLFPSLQLSPAVLAAKYESLQQNVSRLQALHPQHVTQMASA